MMNHIEVMTQAVHTLRSRGDQYGNVETSFDKISKLASLVLNKDVSPYDVAGILHAVKLSRMSNDPSNPDHYVDGINYMAFMAQFAGIPTSQEVNVEDDIAALARKFAPSITNEGTLGGSE